MASYEDLRSKMESLDAGVDKANASVARVDKAMVDLTKAEELGARTERQLNALKTLSDHITGKVASVERQREAMDRTEAQARALTDLHWELEAKLKEARSQIKRGEKDTLERRKPPRIECQGGGADRRAAGGAGTGRTGQ